MVCALLFKGREIARGSLSAVIDAAANRGALVNIRITKRGWVNTRLLIDLSPDYEWKEYRPTEPKSEGK